MIFAIVCAVAATIAVIFTAVWCYFMVCSLRDTAKLKPIMLKKLADKDATIDMLEKQISDLKAQLEQKNTRPAPSEPRPVAIRPRSMSQAMDMAELEIAKKPA